MKKNNRSLLIMSLIGLGISVSGCSSNPELSGQIQDEAPVVDVTSGSSDDSNAFSKYPKVGDEPSGLEDERSADSLLQKRLVYFDYDKSAVSEDYLAIIEAHADFLVRNPNKSLILSGNTDERGSNEYNLSLGQRRADSVRDIMLANGVSESQLETLIFGEEYPITLGQTEATWAENRRVEIQYSDE